MIDLCLICTLRPDILSRTLDSFKRHVHYSGDINIIANIDCVPKIYSDAFPSVVHAIKSCFDNNRIFINVQPGGNFARAVKTVWGLTKADYVFHLEDDWEFIHDIDLDKATEKMGNYMRFPKTNAPHLGQLFKPACQPSLWAGNYVRIFAEYLKTDKDPEKQLRVQEDNSAEFNSYISGLSEGLSDYSYDWCCKDIGREWRDRHSLLKWSANEPGKGDNAKKVTWL